MCFGDFKMHRKSSAPKLYISGGEKPANVFELLANSAEPIYKMGKVRKNPPHFQPARLTLACPNSTCHLPYKQCETWGRAEYEVTRDNLLATATPIIDSRKAGAKPCRDCLLDETPYVRVASPCVRLKERQVAVVGGYRRRRSLLDI